jgi:hypothetical protein
MTDEPTSETLRTRVFQYIDQRGRPSAPGPREEFVDQNTRGLVDPDVAQGSVEGYERKLPYAGNLEAAGIEPAREWPPITEISGGFEHWKLDGAEAAEHASVVRDLDPSVSSPSNFTAKTTICGIDLEVRRDGKHLNLHMLLHEDGHLERHEDGHLEQWRFEELETAIPKLACILAAARLAANSGGVT